MCVFTYWIRHFTTMRWNPFRSNNLEGEMLPTIRAALLPHITRVNCIAMRDKWYIYKKFPQDFMAVPIGYTLRTNGVLGYFEVPMGYYNGAIG